MGIIPRFTPIDVRKIVAKKMQQIDRVIIQMLQYLGEQCVNHARSLNTYQDQTGNLRASIGYIIVKDGKTLKSNFSGGKEGSSQAKILANKLKSEHSQGFVLIVVAGMNYAKHVEDRNYDVLTSAEMLAERELPLLINQLKRQVAA